MSPLEVIYCAVAVMSVLGFGFLGALVHYFEYGVKGSFGMYRFHNKWTDLAERFHFDDFAWGTCTNYSWSTILVFMCYGVIPSLLWPVFFPLLAAATLLWIVSRKYLGRYESDNT